MNRFPAGRSIVDDDEKLQKTNALRKISLDSIDSYEVLQGQYVIQKYSPKTPSLQTFGIGPCVAVTLYDPKTKTGTLAHIDSTDKAKSFTNVLNQLKYQGIDLNNLEAHIIGGQTGSSEETVGILYDSIKNNSIKLKEIDVLGDNTRAIMLNLENGEVSDYQESIHTTPSPKLFMQGNRTLMDKNLSQDFIRNN